MDLAEKCCKSLEKISSIENIERGNDARDVGGLEDFTEEEIKDILNPEWKKFIVVNLEEAGSEASKFWEMEIANPYENCTQYGHLKMNLQRTRETFPDLQSQNHKIEENDIKKSPMLKNNSEESVNSRCKIEEPRVVENSRREVEISSSRSSNDRADGNISSNGIDRNPKKKRKYDELSSESNKTDKHYTRRRNNCRSRSRSLYQNLTKRQKYDFSSSSSNRHRNNIRGQKISCSRSRSPYENPIKRQKYDNCGDSESNSSCLFSFERRSDGICSSSNSRDRNCIKRTNSGSISGSPCTNPTKRQKYNLSSSSTIDQYSPKRRNSSNSSNKSNSPSKTNEKNNTEENCNKIFKEETNESKIYLEEIMRSRRKLEDYPLEKMYRFHNPNVAKRLFDHDSQSKPPAQIRIMKKAKRRGNKTYDKKISLDDILKLTKNEFENVSQYFNTNLALENSVTNKELEEMENTFKLSYVIYK